MELRRFSRAPLLLIAVAVLLLLLGLDCANSGSSYQQTDTANGKHSGVLVTHV